MIIKMPIIDCFHLSDLSLISLKSKRNVKVLAIIIYI